MEHPIVLAFSLYGAKKSIRIDELLYDILVESGYYMSNFVPARHYPQHTLLRPPRGHCCDWCSAGKYRIVLSRDSVVLWQLPGVNSDGLKDVSIGVLKQRQSYSMIILLNHNFHSWWRHQMETFSALLAICAGNSPITSALIYVWINGWKNNREADDLRRSRSYYDVIVM